MNNISEKIQSIANNSQRVYEDLDSKIENNGKVLIVEITYNPETEEYAASHTPAQMYEHAQGAGNTIVARDVTNPECWIEYTLYWLEKTWAYFTYVSDDPHRCDLTIYDDGTVSVEQYYYANVDYVDYTINQLPTTLAVATNYDDEGQLIASHTPAQISEHVAKGGSVVLNIYTDSEDPTDIYQATLWRNTNTYAEFARNTDENCITKYWFTNDKIISMAEDFYLTFDNIQTREVTLTPVEGKDNQFIASATPASIYEWVQSGRHVVLKIDEESHCEFTYVNPYQCIALRIGSDENFIEAYEINEDRSTERYEHWYARTEDIDPLWEKIEALENRLNSLTNAEEASF